MLRVVEAFSGIGAQKEALEKANIEHEILQTIEWDINAIYAYDIMHNLDNQPSRLSKGEIVSELSKLTLSANGKTALSFKALKQMREDKLQRLYAAIKRNNNLCDITRVTGNMLSDEIDLLTYSFPCQDLSNGSAWYNNDNEGIKKGATTRSGLLWEIERILNERSRSDRPLPKFLLMENVNAITSPKHNGNFVHWQKELEELGYVNRVYRLNALNFGVPQSRSRTFMLSVKKRDQEVIEFADLEGFESEGGYNLSDYLRLKKYSEAFEAMPNFTPSRKKISENNLILANDNQVLAEFTKTISTKQDRNPNAGVIFLEGKMRYLTPRETFLLMGFPESKFEKLKQSNDIAKYFNDSHFYRMSGNSIVVNVLVKIFEEVERLKARYFNE